MNTDTNSAGAQLPPNYDACRALFDEELWPCIDRVLQIVAAKGCRHAGGLLIEAADKLRRFGALDECAELQKVSNAESPAALAYAEYLIRMTPPTKEELQEACLAKERRDSTKTMPLAEFQSIILDRLGWEGERPRTWADGERLIAALEAKQGGGPFDAR